MRTYLDAQFRLPYQVETRPSQEFSFEGAKIKLSNLKTDSTQTQNLKFLVPGEAFSRDYSEERDDLGFTEQQGRLLCMSGSIDMENRVSIGCAGALITYLQRKHPPASLSGVQVANLAFRIRSVEMLSFQGTM